MNNLSSEQIYLQIKNSLPCPTEDVSSKMGRASDSDVKKFNKELSARENNLSQSNAEKLQERAKSLLKKNLGVQDENLAALREASPFLASIANPISVDYKPVAESRASEFAELVERLVSQLLVAEAQNSATQEIQMSLRDSILAGSTIHMVREGDSLYVQFMTLDQKMADLVRENVGVLREGLYEKLNLKSVRVDVQSQENSRDSNQEKGKNSRNSNHEKEQ